MKKYIRFTSEILLASAALLLSPSVTWAGAPDQEARLERSRPDARLNRLMCRLYHRKHRGYLAWFFRKRCDKIGVRDLVNLPVGTAISIFPNGSTNIFLREDIRRVVKRHFNSITLENGMKARSLRPSPTEFSFEAADEAVDFAEENGMIVHGHTLIWHEFQPDWMDSFEGDWEAMMLDHIKTVVSHYKGRVSSWDVVNEAVDQDPITQEAFLRDTQWLRNIGPSYLEKAFRAAHEADPNAELFYNEFGIEEINDKFSLVLSTLKDLRERGVPIHGIGFQMHMLDGLFGGIEVNRPTKDDIKAVFAAAVDAGLKVRISELDVSYNVGIDFERGVLASNGIEEFTPELARTQRRRFQDIIDAYFEVVPPELRAGVSVWGVTDDSNYIWFVWEITDWPHMFDAELRPKPSFFGFVRSLVRGQRN